MASVGQNGRGLRIAIVGVGLIGGSLGMAWRRSGVAAEVVGIDTVPLDDAVRLGAIDRYATDAAEAFAEADVVVLAVPVQAVIDLAETHGHLIRSGTVVTDVGSTKTAVATAWEKHLPSGAAFVGGHPMFGREVSGVEYASADLPAGCRYVLTPGSRSTPQALATIRQLAEAAGAEVVVMAPDAHDRRVAVASHLPQAAATALAVAALRADRSVARGLFEVAALGFRDTTRLADSPAALWADIFATNRAAVLMALDLLQGSLADLRKAIETDDRVAVEKLFDEAHVARLALKRGK